MAPISRAEKETARVLLEETRSAALATLDEEGAPFASYVLIAPGPDNSPFLLLSHLAVHTRNLHRDARSSLLFVRDTPAGAVAAAAIRLTLTGRTVGDDNPLAKRLFLSRHPEAQRYAAFADFGFYRFDVEGGHLVAGFGRIVRFSRSDLLDGPGLEE